MFVQAANSALQESVVAVARFIDSAQHFATASKVALKMHVHMDEFGAKLDAVMSCSSRICKRIYQQCLTHSNQADLKAAWQVLMYRAQGVAVPLCLALTCICVLIFTVQVCFQLYSEPMTDEGLSGRHKQLCTMIHMLCGQSLC